MDSSTLALAVQNLLSPPVLGFALGLLSVAVGGNLRLPDAVYQGLSMYLLLAIGIKGGVALRQAPVADLALPALGAIALGVLIPLAAFWLLRWWTRMGPVDRGAVAAHYGSTSLVTFTAALVFLEASAIAVEGYVTTLLALMEIPGIIVGLLLAGRGASRGRASSRASVPAGSVPGGGVPGGGVPAGSDPGGAASVVPWSASLREVLTGNSVLLLVGGLLIGALTGPSGYTKIEPFFGALFVGVLTLFLIELGVLAGRRLPDLRSAGLGLLAFAMVFPLLAGTAGVLMGAATGMSLGGATVLGVLCASASYIAAPAAVRLALPEANPGYYLTASLGVTFPFNLIIGIPIYLAIAERLIA